MASLSLEGSEILPLAVVLGVFLLFLGFQLVGGRRKIKGTRKGGWSEFDKIAARTAKSRRLALDLIQRQLEIKLTPGREIHIESLSRVNTPLIKMRLGAQISNPSEYVIVIEQVRWELWLGPVVKTFMTTPHMQLKAKKEIADFVVQGAMNDQEFMKLARIADHERAPAYLEGVAVCETDFGRFEKKFVGFDIPYQIKGNIGGMVDGAQSEKSSNTDSLTGLLQRKFIEESFQAIIDTVAQRQPVSLIMFDVDHFKAFNDDYGHLIGDEILKTVSAKLKEVIGEKGLAVRYGGDEFCVILEGMDSEEAEKLARKLHREVGECRLRVPQGELKITLSIGVAVLRRPADYQSLIMMADKALYESKRKGRNQVTADHTGVF